ncbi:MAG: ATP-grasp domain-containing protein [Pseudomonadota bacterium]
MNKTILLTLGRLPKGLELARALHGAGVRVIVADPFGTHLAKPSRAVAKSFVVTAPNSDLEAYLDELERIVREEHVDLVIPVSEEALYVLMLAERIGAERIFSDDAEKVLKLHDKLQFQMLVADAGLEGPLTMRADDPAVSSVTAETDWVLKPRLGCSGGGLMFGSRGAVPPAEKTDPQNVLQRRIRGREISSLTVARSGNVLGTALYEGRLFSGTVAVSFQRIRDAYPTEQWIADFVRAVDYTGFIAFDFIVDEGGRPWPIECNPRLTSGVHFMEHASLAAAVLGDSGADKIGFKDAHSLQEGHTSLLKAYAAAGRPKEFLRRMKMVFTTGDVLWSWRDPWPFLLMTPMSWPVLNSVIFEGDTFGEAATRDIEWRGARAGVAEKSRDNKTAPVSRVRFSKERFQDEAAPLR